MANSCAYGAPLKVIAHFNGARIIRSPISSIYISTKIYWREECLIIAGFIIKIKPMQSLSFFLTIIIPTLNKAVNHPLICKKFCFFGMN